MRVSRKKGVRVRKGVVTFNITCLHLATAGSPNASVKTNPKGSTIACQRGEKFQRGLM